MHSIISALLSAGNGHWWRIFREAGRRTKCESCWQHGKKWRVMDAEKRLKAEVLKKLQKTLVLDRHLCTVAVSVTTVSGTATTICSVKVRLVPRSDRPISWPRYNRLNQRYRSPLFKADLMNYTHCTCCGLCSPTTRFIGSKGICWSSRNEGVSSNLGRKL